MKMRLPMVWLLTLFAAPPAIAADTTPLEFNEHIRPILAANCFACHGLDAKRREAELRLDVGESALADRGGYFAIKPGDPAGSEVWARINSDDEDAVMPPPSSNKQLTAEQKELIRRWIEQGANYQKHWAFEPPRKPPVPQVSERTWARNAVDRFIIARLEREGLEPQPEADRETLLRRVSFALTGLPPAIAELDRFLADTSPSAYEDMVDRYLASPRFGEEMARHWLDVARYADTHGLHLDNERHMWAYRDWVVKALNDNLPFDQFTLWQLAGDLLPDPTPDQLTATGFNRCNVTTSEGGAIADEFLFRYAVDRTSTVLETWMGLTGGCAVCHDHKYDPLSMKEFYSLYAFFYSAADPGMDKNVNDTEPFLRLPSAEQQAALEDATRAEEEARRQLELAVSELDYQDPAELDPPPPAASITDVLFDDFFPLGSSVRNTTRNPSLWDTDLEFGVPSGRRVLRQANSYFHEDTIQGPLLPWIVPANACYEVWVRLDPLNVPQNVTIVFNTNRGTRQIRWGREVAIEGRTQTADTTARRDSVPAAGGWTRLTFRSDELELAAGDRITSIALQEVGGVVWWDALTVTGERNPASDPAASFVTWWKTAAGKSSGDVPPELDKVLAAGPDKPHTPAQRESLLRFYLAHIARPASAEHAQRQSAWEQAHGLRLAADQAIAGTMVFRDLEKPRQAFMMLRGQYQSPGEQVEPGVPNVFPGSSGLTDGRRATRLDLARWLVAPEHPLTARVTVNRFWQQLFGTGLVKTSFDFGSQGEPPSHPELLDWLAVQFQETGWDVKRLVRLLVTSATFRQQSHGNADLHRRDPENRWYARGPRFRLDAEQIRDNALYVSGLLDATMGGRGVKPYQPPNIWEPVGYGDSNTRYYLQDHGGALYRRSLYCFLKRTAPPPFMSNFDGPNREQFCSRRERSNTPLQALQLMNDVQHFEAARALAERTLAERDQTAEQRITYLYRTILARRPDMAEIDAVKAMLSKQIALYEAEPQAALDALGVGESAPRNVAPPTETAAWTLVANLLLNLDETVTRN